MAKAAGGSACRDFGEEKRGEAMALRITSEARAAPVGEVWHGPFVSILVVFDSMAGLPDAS
jgi:hypothetical protein